MTSYDEIYDLFLTGIRDFKIDRLYQQSPADFSSYLQGFLNRAIPFFTNCKKDLTKRNEYSETFSETLSELEKLILANLMQIEWLNREINDVTQMNLHLNDTDFKHYSEAQNLKEKVVYRSHLKEEISNLMTMYGLQNVPWKDWASGDFS